MVTKSLQLGSQDFTGLLIIMHIQVVIEVKFDIFEIPEGVHFQ